MKQTKLLIIAMLLTFVGFSCNSSKKATNNVEPQSQRGERGGDRKPRSIDDIFQMDVDKDGKISKSEVKGRLKERFDTIDTNKDGFLTREEVQNAPKPQRGQRPSKG